MLEVVSSLQSWRIGTEPPQLHAQGNTGVVRWETTRGSLNVDVGADNSIVMPNQSWYGPASIISGNEAVKITARDDVSVVEVRIDAYATFPYQADWRFQSEVDEKVEISEAEDNNETYRILSGLYGKWEMVYGDREHIEYLNALAFRAFHGKNRFFYLEDFGLEELQLVRFDSPLRRSPEYADGKNYSFTIRCIDWKLPAEAGGEGSLFGVILPGDGLFGG
jgi:hypothetical protein